MSAAASRACGSGVHRTLAGAIADGADPCALRQLAAGDVLQRLISEHERAGGAPEGVAVPALLLRGARPCARFENLFRVADAYANADLCAPRAITRGVLTGTESAMVLSLARCNRAAMWSAVLAKPDAPGSDTLVDLATVYVLAFLGAFSDGAPQVDDAARARVTALLYAVAADPLSPARAEMRSLLLGNVPALTCCLTLYMWDMAAADLFPQELDILCLNERARNSLATVNSARQDRAPNNVLFARVKAASRAASKPAVAFQEFTIKTLAHTHPELSCKLYSSAAAAAKWARHINQRLLASPHGPACVSLRSLQELVSAPNQTHVRALVIAWAECDAKAGECSASELTAADAAALADGLRARAFGLSVGRTPLPRKVAKRIIRAVKRRFLARVPLVGIRRKALERVCQQNTRFSVCSVCRRVCTSPHDAQNPGRYVSPSQVSGCLHDAESQAITCKGSATAKHRTMLCNVAELVQIEMVNMEAKTANIVTFEDISYVLSPCCALLCRTDDVRWGRRGCRPGRSSCPGCRADASAPTHVRVDKACQFCGEQKAPRLMVSVTMFNGDNEPDQVTLCKTHTQCIPPHNFTTRAYFSALRSANQ